MFKTISKSIIASIAVLLFAGSVFAASPVSIRLELPKSPTNQNTFKITFVTLDVQGRAITVRCFKKGPSDGAFSQFGGDILLAAGGNTSNCDVNGSIVSSGGTYAFYAGATAGPDSATSATVTVDYNTSGPGTPTNYSKEKTACTYKIKFRSADDSGKTVQVRLYRTDSATSEAVQVDSIAIGSSTEGQFENTIPDCGKEYFYALRAFDSAGNSSGLVGDSISIITTSTTTTTQTTGAGTVTGSAIPVGEGQGQVLGEETQEEKEILGEGTPSGEQETEGQKEKQMVSEKGGLFTSKNILSGAIVLGILALIYLWYKKSKQV